MTIMDIIRPIAPHVVIASPNPPVTPVRSIGDPGIPPNDDSADPIPMMINAIIASMIPPISDIMNPAVAFFTGAGGVVVCVCKLSSSSGAQYQFNQH